MIPRPCLCLITHRRRLSPDARTTTDAVLALERWLDDAFGIVDMIQIREPDVPPRDLMAVAARLRVRAEGSGTRILVNDRVDLALAASTDGVHVPERGFEPVRVQAIAPAEWTIGRSVHSSDEARRSIGASYLIFGTVFATASKPDTAPLAGLDGLRAAASATTVPMLAVGGVTPDRAAACVEAGAAGVAAISPFLPRARDKAGMGVVRAAALFREAMIGRST